MNVVNYDYERIYWLKRFKICNHSFKKKCTFDYNLYRNPTLAKCGGEAQHLEKVSIWNPPGFPNG